MVSLCSSDRRRYPRNQLVSSGVFIAVLLAILPSAARGGYDLLVTSMASNRVLRFDGQTGAFIDALVPANSGLLFPIGIALGADENIYVCSSLTDSVRRYDADSGAAQGTFASGGGMDFPQSAIFGPDGHLYVGDANTAILRYNGVTGAFMGAFTSGGPLNGAFGLTFGPDGHLYVSSFGNNLILRYDGTTGDFIDVFASGNGLASPYGLTFGPDSNLYVVSSETSSVLRFDGQTGVFIDVFVATGTSLLVSPVGLAFGPDAHLYVSSFNSHSIMKYDGASGALIGPFVFPASGGLLGPAYFLFRHICGDGDLNGDGFVDDDDVPIFVDTLLGLDTDAGHLDEADLSCDGAVDGLDVGPFVRALLGV